MKQQIREVTLSLQHLSAVVLPELKRVSSVILASASDAGLTQAGTLQTLLLDAHRIADAALKGLAQVVKEDRTTDDSGVVQTRKPPLPVDVELEVLRFCSRVDLDKMQLVSKAKRVLVDNMSSRLALHYVHRVDARDHHFDVGKRCIVTYSTAQYREEVSTAVREEIPVRGNDAYGRVSLNPSPFRRMRNAYVGAARLYPHQELTAEFKDLLDAFISHHKDAMQMGLLHLCYSMNEEWITYLLGFLADVLHAKCLVVTDFTKTGNSTFIDRIFAAPAIRKVRRIAIDVSTE